MDKYLKLKGNFYGRQISNKLWRYCWARKSARKSNLLMSFAEVRATSETASSTRRNIAKSERLRMKQKQV